MYASIIIPNYNGEKFIGACLDSCLAQGTDVVKEIIVVDDHSTDNSWNIIRSYREKYPRQIVTLRNKGKGAQAARNLGFAVSTGQYVQWLDSDDLLGDHKIEYQLASHSDSESVISFGAWYSFKEDTRQILRSGYSGWPVYIDPIDFLTLIWKKGYMVPNAAWLVPSSICEQIHWREDVLINQDGIYFFDALMHVKHLRFVKNATTYYRTPTQTNISQNRSDEALKSLLRSYRHYENILLKRDSSDVRISLAGNYSRYIALVYPRCRNLIKEAENCIVNLGLRKIPCSGGRRFNLLCNILGFKFALKFRTWFRRMGI